MQIACNFSTNVKLHQRVLLVNALFVAGRSKLKGLRVQGFPPPPYKSSASLQPFSQDLTTPAGIVTHMPSPEDKTRKQDYEISSYHVIFGKSIVNHGVSTPF